jgi:hypothetical protein
MDTLLTVGLVGSFMAAVTAMHLHLTAPLPELAPVRPIDDIDAEFLRIVEHGRLRGAWPTP